MAKKIIKARLKQRTDTQANWAANNPVLLDGELGLVTDDKNLYKVGDGVTAWNDLPFRGFDGTLVHETGDSDNAAMSQRGVTQALDKLKERMVEKVPGKGLSTEDYTTEEKRKLAGLQNFDDTEIKNQLNELYPRVGTCEQELDELQHDVKELGENVDKELEETRTSLEDSSAAFREEIATELARQNQNVEAEFAAQNEEIATEFAKQNKEIEGKVSADGKYPDLTAGFASNLVGRGEAVEAEINFRPSGGGSINDGTARIAELKGNSVVWNEIFEAYPGSSGTKVINGVTYTLTAEGDLTAEGTAEGTSAVFVVTATELINTHKYLINAPSVESSWGTWALYFNAYTIDSLVLGGWSIFQATNTHTANMVLACWADNTISVKTKVAVYDLTRMFGAGNEPLTLEEFYQRIPQNIDTNAYNEGELISYKGEALKSVGFNAWDEQWELGTITEEGVDYPSQAIFRPKGYIKVLPNTQYAITSPSHQVLYVFYFDSNKGLISFKYFERVLVGEVITTPANCAYLRFIAVLGTTYNNDICINLAHTGYRNGEYEPYKEFTREIDPRIREAFADGMKPWDNVYNKNGKGYIVKGTGTIEDLGAFAWDIIEGSFSATSVQTNANLNYDNRLCTNIICTKLLPDVRAYGGPSNDDYICFDRNIIYISGPIANSNRDSASLKNALKDVSLYYELAEPIVTEYDEPFNLDYLVWDFGTEESIAEGASAPLRADIIYQFNAVDNIRNNKLTLDDVLRRLQQLESMVSTMQAASVRVE